MSKILNVENGAVIVGYDSLAASEWCTPSFLGCSMCISASAVKGQVTINIALKTPFGNVSKSFSFNTNTSFTWQPFSKFKITVSIANFNEASGVFSFDLGVNPCVDVPFLGWKCFNYSHTFSVPLLLHGIENEIDDSQFASILALHASGSLNAPCQCDDHSGSSMLKGDIYNNYLNNQAAIPTLPITSCVPTLSCTGIPVICASQQADANTAAIPTLPITSCVPTLSCTGIPVICLAQQQTAPQAPIPTVPGICIPTLTCTLISHICLTQQQAAPQAAAIPTLPITSCVPTLSCTGIPVICLAQQHAAPQAAAIPTLPITSCVPTLSCTGIPVICLAQQQAPQTAAIPTLPITSCVPTLSCTGIPVICLAQQQAAPQAAAIPTLPITSCVPTLSCTGIPIIC